MTDTLETLRELVQEKFDVDASKIDSDVSILESGLDSLALAELMFAVEDTFAVRLPETAREVTSLRDLARLIDETRNHPPKKPATPLAAQEDFSRGTASGG